MVYRKSVDKQQSMVLPEIKKKNERDGNECSRQSCNETDIS